MIRGKFVHANIVAQDWERLADFYERVFGCTRVPPERDLSGKWLDRATRVAGARILGVHLRLPGYDQGGPTLEIFQYNRHEERPASAVNRPGFAHIAFLVEDVEAARDVVLDAGGGEVGPVVSVPIPGAGVVTFVYLTDPEGNILELQSWS